MGIRPGNNWTTEDLDYIGRPREKRFDSWGTAEILTEYRERIATGQPMDGISELGGLHRQLLQESDFHAIGKTLLKKLQPEEESERFKFDGRNLPEDLKTILTTLSDLDIDTSSLKNTILLADENDEILSWISNNWQVFVEMPMDDALEVAEGEVIDTYSEDFYLPAEQIKKDRRPPRDSYRVVEVFKKNRFKEAAEYRLVSLKDHISSIKDCNDLEELSKLLWAIKGTYEEDKKLLELWSHKQYELDRKMYLTSLHTQREREEVLKKEGKTISPLDFESIRRKMWFYFDQQQKETPIEKVSKPLRKEWINHVDLKSGKILETGYITDEECNLLVKKGKPDPRKYISERITTSSSVWEKEKSFDFCQLNQTKEQWNKIYSNLWKKMTQLIVWKIKSLKNVSEGFKLAEYIRRFQFRLDPDMLGQAILEKAKKTKTEKSKNLIRLFLASFQYQLDKDIKKAITKELIRRI